MNDHLPLHIRAALLGSVGRMQMQGEAETPAGGSAMPPPPAPAASLAVSVSTLDGAPDVVYTFYDEPGVTYDLRTRQPVAVDIGAYTAILAHGEETGYGGLLSPALRARVDSVGFHQDNRGNVTYPSVYVYSRLLEQQAAPVYSAPVTGYAGASPLLENPRVTIPERAPNGGVPSPAPSPGLGPITPPPAQFMPPTVNAADNTPTIVEAPAPASEGNGGVGLLALAALALLMSQ